MRFSVIIPAHDTEEYIKRAIQSVQRQTFTDYELIVICDACSDGTEEAARACAVRENTAVLVIDRGSPGAARNAGLDRAKGEYILFLDSDDYYFTDQALEFIDEQLRAQDLDVLHFGFLFGRRPVGILNPNGNGLWCNVWSRAWRRKFIGQIRFDEEARTAEDLDFCMRVFHRPSVRQAGFNVPLVQYTYPRPGSLTWEAEHGDENDNRGTDHAGAG